MLIDLVYKLYVIVISLAREKVLISILSLTVFQSKQEQKQMLQLLVLLSKS